MSVLDRALLNDVRGEPLPLVGRFRSSSWSEITDWSRALLSVDDLHCCGRAGLPEADCHKINLGRIRISRSSYGVPTRIEIGPTSVARTFVLTTLRGQVQHRDDARDVALVAKPGEALVLRTAGSRHALQLSADCVLLTIAMEPDLLNEVSIDWFGCTLDAEPLPNVARIGGEGSGWNALLTYVVLMVSEASDQLALGRLGRHLKNTICRHVLSELFNQAGPGMFPGAGTPTPTIAPRMIRRAEAYMIEHAADVPKLAEIARVANTSVRNLTQRFRETRGYTVAQFLTEQRLRCVRRELLLRDRPRTVGEVARRHGFVNLGEFSKKYQNRFGELPSATLKN